MRTMLARWLTVAALALASWPAFGQATLNFNAFNLQGQIPNANILNPATTVNGVTCTLGSTCTIPGSASIAVGSTSVTGGTSGRVLYDNAGVLGERVLRRDEVGVHVPCRHAEDVESVVDDTVRHAVVEVREERVEIEPGR